MASETRLQFKSHIIIMYPFLLAFMIAPIPYLIVLTNPVPISEIAVAISMKGWGWLKCFDSTIGKGEKTS